MTVDTRSLETVEARIRRMEYDQGRLRAQVHEVVAQQLAIVRSLHTIAYALRKVQRSLEDGVGTRRQVPDLRAAVALLEQTMEGLRTVPSEDVPYREQQTTPVYHIAAQDWHAVLTGSLDPVRLLDASFHEAVAIVQAINEYIKYLQVRARLAGT